MRKECKAIAKKVVNAIVGHEILKPSTPKVSANQSSGPTTSKTLHSDVATYKTEKTSTSSVEGKEYRSTSNHLDGQKGLDKINIKLPQQFATSLVEQRDHDT